MSGKLADIEARSATARQLDAVIGAMRGIAAARSREAQGRLPGIRSSALTVGTAIGAVLAHGRGEPPLAASPDHGAQIVIVLCSEQGFVGSFNERILDYVQASRNKARCKLLAVGTRGLAGAGERRLEVTWCSPAASRADEVSTLAGRVTDALYERLADRSIDAVSVVHALPEDALSNDIVERSVIPFDFSRFPVAERSTPPLLNLPVETVLAGLAETYVFVEICEALMLSFAAENQARMRAMLAARSNARDTLQELMQRYRRVRQEEITDDIAELAATLRQPD